jgi:hypothetical protein
MSATTPDGERLTPVPAGPDDMVSARMPTPAERRALGILAPDVPVLSVKRPGQTEELFDARLVTIVVGGPQDTHH